MFFKKKEKTPVLQEAPLGYWEEESYMMAVPKDESKDILDGLFERVAAIEGVEIKAKCLPNEDHPGRMILVYDGEEYEVGFFEGGFMKALATERFHFVKEQADHKDNKIIIKIGLPVDGEDCDMEHEHIWFELVVFDGDRFKARLLQEPYNVEGIHTGDEGWYTVEDVTDWIIYTPDFTVSPDKAYLLV